MVLQRKLNRICSQFFHIPIVSCNFEEDARKIKGIKTVRPYLKKKQLESCFNLPTIDMWSSLVACFDQ